MQNGDFIKIDFVGRISDTNEIFDLTDADLARKERIYNEKIEYKPVLVILGAGMVIPGVEKQLEGMNVGDEKEFEIEPSEAFGLRNPKRIRIISFTNFMKASINPSPGSFVNIDGMQAKIQSVSGGRVRVDFNHPLAGRRVHYRLKIASQITDDLEKAKSILEYYSIKAESVLKESKLEVKTEKPLEPIIAKLIETTITKWITGIKAVEFISEQKPLPKLETMEHEKNINLSAEKPDSQKIIQKA